MKILLVEDHAELAGSMASYLVQENYVCEVAASFDAAREKLALFSYDCVVLDMMLPDGNGLNLLKLLRKEGSESSVIISAQNSLGLKLAGLGEGADDYITKPFPLPELLARLKAIMRRRSPHKNNVLTFQDITADLGSMECRVGASC